MRTLGRPKGAARQAALAGIAASLMVGLAACGNTVAGTGAAGPGSAAGAARATTRPSPGAVNPGGVRIPASATAQAAMCREIPRLTRITFMLSTQPSNVHAREALPHGFTIRDPATVRHLATQLCALPRVPEIARDALAATGAYHELERFDTDPVFRDRLSARVAEHIKVLRHKITDRGLVSPDTRLSDEVVVRLLIEHGIVTAADLGKLNDPAWCSRQEDLWWSRDG